MLVPILSHRSHSLGRQQRDLAYHLTEHLRIQGVYWGLTALAFMRRQDALPRDDMVEWVMGCYLPDVGPSDLLSPLCRSSRSWSGVDGRVRRQERSHPTRDTTPMCIRP